jgi:hypothetical protein
VASAAADDAWAVRVSSAVRIRAQRESELSFEEEVVCKQTRVGEGGLETMSAIQRG